MSAKWRAIQHRHRYTYNSVFFPKPYIETLNLLPQEAFSSFNFFPILKDFISLNSTYSQISAAKDLSSSFTQLLNSPYIQEGVFSSAIRLYLEILFLENSLPLHRTLISPLSKNKKFLSVICSCFVALCKEYGDLGKKGIRRFLVSRAALSLMGYPKLGFLNEAVEKCSILVATDIASGLAGVILDVDRGSRPSPLVMEQCQDAMSCLYYLLQKFPHTFSVPEEDFCTFEEIIDVILSVLKSSAFSRDCLVAAGVSFCAAIQARVRSEDVSCFLSKAVFDFSGGDRDIMEFAGNLCFEIRGFSILSRLCLLRGIVTAVSRAVLNVNFKSANGSIWTLLYNAILPELCQYCEKPIDRHFNFHALTVLQICLQQMKTSILVGLTNVSGDYDPLPEEMTSRLLRVIWNNLEDPLSQTVKQVHLIFDLLLDIKSSLPSKDGNENNRAVLCKIALDLLRLGARCKGKYVPLASLGKRLGSKSLLDLNPNLLFETIYGYIDDDVCCAVTSFLKCFLECLRDECWCHDGIEEGYATFRKLCLPPLLQGLVSGNSKLRTNLNTYALPALLEVDSDSIFPMLSFISVGPFFKGELNVDLKLDSCVAAVVSLLKVSRTLALIEGDIDLESDSLNEPCGSRGVAVVCLKGTNVRVLVDWLILALTHADECLRIDAAESLFLNPKSASLPSSLELMLMREAVPLNMRCSSTAFQMKWTSLFRKFFVRVRLALERQVKQGQWKPVTCNGGASITTADLSGVSVIHRAEHLFQFMKWLSCFLFYSCYPSAPYERKTMAMELIIVMMDVWPPKMLQDNHNICPYSEGLISADSTLLLVGSIIDSWDKLRQNSFRILLCFPTPLPGISSHDTVNMAIHWAKRLVCSPRVRESDAGALTFRLLFRKYVMDLGWSIQISLSSAQIDSQSHLMSSGSNIFSSKAPLLAYISALIEWLRVSVEEGEKDLSEACRNSFVHGVLLTLRYTFEELDWNSEEVVSSSMDFRCLLQNLLELIMRVTSLALWVVSADAWYMPYDMDDVIDEDNFVSDSSLGMDSIESSLEQVYTVKKYDNNEKPAEHAVMVGCWLAMKEVSLLLGTIIRKVPLPSCSLFESSMHDYPVRNGDETEVIVTEDGLLDLQQLESIGSHFLQVLLKMKHNGAIDKTRAGFTALCNRLLCSNNPRLCKMTEAWMGQLMERTIAKGQTVDDLLRRSAGIPAAFIAFFLSEPEGTPKMLLPKALSWLINVAKKSLSKDFEGSNQNKEVPHKIFIEDHNEANGSASKMRNEGVIPTVHAFNVLRASFNDTNLASDTSGFCAEALIVAIRSFSSPYWEVRNSACLAYTSLVRRMIGFLNVHKRESSRRALTGLEFFHRYPALHPFLCSELEVATKQLGDEYSMDADLNITKSVHPSLCPILILLSRLNPSLISIGADDLLDPFMLTPFIRRCGTQSNLRVRVLAARALIGLVSNEKLQGVITDATCSLPLERHLMARTSFSFNSIHGILLQLSSLLDNNCMNLTDIMKKDDIISEVIDALRQRSWIGSIRSCPCPMLNSLFLIVLDQMSSIALSYSSKHTIAIQTLLMNLAFECMNEKNISGPALYDPTMVELRKQAAASYFSCLFGTKNEAPNKCLALQNFSKSTFKPSKLHSNNFPVSELQERIVSCISDSMYEVRIITLKKLLQLANCMISGSDDERTAICVWVKTTLQSDLIQLLSKEENPKCIYYMLKIIFACSALQSNEFMDWNTAFCFWDTLVHLKDTVRRAKTREILHCCMAICTKTFAKMLRSFTSGDEHQIQGEITRAFKCINSFIILTKQHSAPSEPVNMRRAAAEAIVASGLLEEAIFVASHVSNNCVLSEAANVIEEEELQADIPEFVNLYASRILDLWFVCIQLLEDEDILIRQNIAMDVQKYIDFRGFEVPRQVDQVIEVILGFLSKIFSHWLEYIEYLLRYVSMAAGSVSFHGDLVRKIFEKEIDNHHEEKLLICQICCFHLEKLLVPGLEGLWVKLLRRWRLRFLHQLISFADGFLVTEGDKDWIGGIGNHKDAFISLYTLLLGLYVLFLASEGVRDLDELYLSKFSEFKKIMRPFLQNPLISNLFLKLIKLVERLGVSLGLESLEPKEYNSGWEEFDPYFLLR
ncbi:hypothetical protein IEQ34_010477 [Dendrobium chrysotoxum]|uniref:DUF2428 domain-containing protein n=1 Tax=Dendrobium chrysotoxum TaxID=161865 RepID=A0AAV7GWK1_DENCH|nr:hypothetical protein IEQ34_010477 [Dendrobium chrysotoxum]